MLDFSEFYRAPRTFGAEGFRSCVPGLRSLFLEGPEYRGKPTRIFAWYGYPETHGDEKRPGIVLVHGGLGTAFAGWVKRWTDRGYAAIALDIFGGLPFPDGSYGSKNPPERHRFSGPGQDDLFANTVLPPEEQWPFHAAAGIISAASFLAAQPEVDPEKIGLTGISWGGYASLLAAGFDPRFRFVMPVYGCGGFDLLNLVPRSVPGEYREKFAELWDPDRYLPEVKTPILWVNGASDPFFDVFCWNRSSSLPANSFRSLRPSMLHGQRNGEEPAELEAFADAVLKRASYPNFTSVECDEKNLELRGRRAGEFEVRSAEIVVTRASGKWNDCLFRNSAAEQGPEPSVITGKLPFDWSAAYLLLRDGKDRICTSEVIFRGGRAPDVSGKKLRS